MIVLLFVLLWLVHYRLIIFLGAKYKFNKFRVTDKDLLSPEREREKVEQTKHVPFPRFLCVFDLIWWWQLRRMNLPLTLNHLLLPLRLPLLLPPLVIITSLSASSPPASSSRLLMATSALLPPATSFSERSLLLPLISTFRIWVSINLRESWFLL